MQKLTQYELESILYWQSEFGRQIDLSLFDLEGASLRNANLSCADLSCAGLRSVRGNGIEIKSVHFLKYDITWTEDRLQIGCKNYSIECWENFSDVEIAKMDDGEIEFWKECKDKILSMAKYGK